MSSLELWCNPTLRFMWDFIHDEAFSGSRQNRWVVLSAGRARIVDDVTALSSTKKSTTTDTVTMETFKGIVWHITLILRTDTCLSGTNPHFIIILVQSYIGLLRYQPMTGKSGRPDLFHIWCDLTKSDAHIEAVKENWHLSRPIRGGCTSSSCLTHTLPAGCVCCLWPYLSPYVSAGCTVRWRSQLNKWSQRNVFCLLSQITVVCPVRWTTVSHFSTKNRLLHCHCIMFSPTLLQSYFFSALYWRMGSNTCIIHFMLYTANKSFYWDIKNDIMVLYLCEVAIHT